MSDPIARVTIRRASPRDAAAIARVHVDSWQAAYLGLIPAALLNAMSVPAHERSWHRILSRGALAGARVWVLVADGRTLGFASAGPSRDRDHDPRTIGEVYTLYLLPDAWGRGLGAALLEAALADLSRRRFSTVALWVLEGNTRARRFYELSGFERDGARKQARVGPGHLPEIRYRRSL